MPASNSSTSQIQSHSSRETLAYYENQAKEFASQTKDAPMGDLQKQFLGYLKPGSRILDFGCGSGRDAIAFSKAGFRTDALDGCQAFCEQLEGRISGTILHQAFADFAAEEIYDGIWACASLLHLEKQDLLPVLRALFQALKPGGIFYCSFKEGDYEGMRNGRYFLDLQEETLVPLLKAAGFEILEVFESEDCRKDRTLTWINAICKKP